MATVIPVKGEFEDIPNPGKYTEALEHFPEWILQGGERHPWGGSLVASKTESAEVFLHRDIAKAAEEGWPVNPRAQKFLSSRGLPILVRGTVLYLSAEEWKAFLPGGKVPSSEPEDESFDEFLESLKESKIAIPPESSDTPKLEEPDDPLTFLAEAMEAMRGKPKKEKWVDLHGDTFPSKEAIKHRFGGRYDGRRAIWTVPEHLSVEAQLYVDSHRRKGAPVPAGAQTSVLSAPFKFPVRCRKCMREIPNWKYRNFGPPILECPKEDEAACLAAERAELAKLPF